jgi:3-oxoacyl-[acyl-carrier protein] reductase
MTGVLAILGGCGGIGRQLVTEAVAAGYDVRVLDLPRSIEAHPPDVPALPVDATSEDDLRRAAEALPEDLAGAVNLAGFMADKRPVAEVDLPTWTEVVTGNLTASHLFARTLAPRLAKGGALVMTGSGLGHLARPGYGPYAISKAGIAALTRQLALELAPDIRVNCVSPSAVDTAFLRGGTGRSDETGPVHLDLETYTRAIPLGRIAEARDITGPILFLLSDAARYMTGQVLHVNGGTHMP